MLLLSKRLYFSDSFGLVMKEFLMDRDDIFKKLAAIQIDFCALTLEEHQVPVKIFLPKM